MIYKSFAQVYDNLMTDTPYELWLEHLLDAFKRYDLAGKEILDLACGTGEMSSRLARKGYKVIGVDLSPEMLEIAQEKSYSNNLQVIYVNQDLKELELHKKSDSVISFCDGFNYILDQNDLLNIFKKINTYLNDNGLFIFDISSEYKLKNVLGQNVFSDTGEEVTYIWENYYDEETKILEFDLTIFTKENDLYKREEETHYQRAYSIDEIKSIMQESGFELLDILNTNTNEKVSETAERIMFIGKKVSNEE